MAKDRGRKKRIREQAATYNAAKQVRAAADPPSGKHPRFGIDPESFQRQRISWHLGRFDYQGPYCFTIIQPEGIPAVLDKLKSFESRTWAEILGPQSHAIAVEQLDKPGRERLEELELDDVSELISLRFSGKERVFGIRTGAVLAILWWDPDHQVCPSVLKHT